MITIRLFRNEKGWSGFRSEGHAGYAEEGSDIICAAVSALTINAVNSIESIAGDTVESEMDDGYLECRFPHGLSESGKVLMESMILGLRMTAETTDENGSPYLTLIIEEDFSHAEYESSALRS